MSENIVVPKFANESEEAEWWDTHRSDVEIIIQERLRSARREGVRFVNQGRVAKCGTDKGCGEIGGRSE